MNAVWPVVCTFNDDDNDYYYYCFFLFTWRQQMNELCTMKAHANQMTFLTFNCDCMVLINDFISSALLSAVDEPVLTLNQFLHFVLIMCLRFSFGDPFFPSTFIVFFCNLLCLHGAGRARSLRLYIAS